MNKFLAIKEGGGTILFSALLDEPPADDILLELFPDPQKPGNQLVTQRGLEILKLRSAGLRQPEIAEKLGLTPSQVAYTSAKTKNYLHSRGVPSCIEVDIPALRRILGLKQRERTGCTLLSELLRDMPSDEELLHLFIDRGNIPGNKSCPTNEDLQLLQMRLQGDSYDSIGEKFGLDAKETRRRITLTLKRIRLFLRVELDVPELYKPKRSTSTSNQPSDPPSPPKDSTELNCLSERQKEVWLLHEQGLSRKQIAEKLGITYNAVRERIHHAERRFREYARYCAVQERNKEPVFLPLTRGEVKIIIKALQLYQQELASGTHYRPGNDWIGKLPFEATIVANLYDRANTIIYGTPTTRILNGIQDE